MPTPLTGYDPSSGNASGIGGRVRAQKISDYVDAAAGNGKSASAPEPDEPSGGGKQHPAASSYAPSEDSAVVSHVYGSPIEGNQASK
jgi:hypothetical protein